MASLAILSATQHRGFCGSVLAAAGCERREAELVARVLLWSDLRAIPGQGIQRLPILTRRLASGLVRSPVPPRLESLGPALERLDAGHGFGEVAGTRAMRRAMELAASQGIGLVGVTHSNHFGAASYYCHEAATAGYLGLACSNAYPKVAPHGGTQAVLGTNPLAFGCPTARGPILVDFATASYSGSGLRSAAGRGDRLAPGSALDADGRPTDDPAAAACLLPAAGPKGYGLGLMVEILSAVLTGAAFGREVGSVFQTWDRPVDVGHCFIAIGIERFMDGPGFIERVERLLGWITSVPPAQGEGPVRYPGELRASAAASAERDGIPVPTDSLAALEELAREVGVSTPWSG